MVVVVSSILNQDILMVRHRQKQLVEEYYAGGVSLVMNSYRIAVAY